MAKAPPSIAATSTLAMVRTAEARGVRTEDLLAEAGLTLGILEDPDARLPGATVMALWSALRERTADPVLQLAAPTSLPFGSYRVLEYLIGASRTVGEGVGHFASFFRLIADGVTLEVERDGRDHCLRVTMADGTPVPPVYVDYIFAALVGRVRMRIRPELRVHRVELRQSQPATIDRYCEVFRAPVRFGAAVDRLCFTDQEWQAPIEGADEALARLLKEHARILAQRITETSSGFRTQVEQAITGSLPGASASRVARALHVSVRTLQRKLVSSGTTFREVSEAVCKQLALSYLANPKVSIAEVTFLLGFSDPSSFTRAFRRWTGESPGRWRRRGTPVR